jgi:hypothetical protein
MIRNAVFEFSSLPICRQKKGFCPAGSLRLRKGRPVRVESLSMGGDILRVCRCIGRVKDEKVAENGVFWLFYIPVSASRSLPFQFLC